MTILDPTSTLAGLMAQISNVLPPIIGEATIPPNIVPPYTVATHDRYIVTLSTQTHEWNGHEQDIADWSGTAWDYTTPAAGDAVKATSNGHLWVYDAGGDLWRDCGVYSEPVATPAGLTDPAASAGIAAAQIAFTPPATISSTNLQAALDEIVTRLVALE